MTVKDLLLDLCARLPYGITIYRITDNSIHRFHYSDITENIDQFSHFIEYSGVDNIKPYLRPMSSMTEEEKQQSRWYQCDAKNDDFILYMNRYVEWLDSHYFDWRTNGNGKTMIEKGLALPAPKDMYNKMEKTV